MGEVVDFARQVASDLRGQGVNAAVSAASLKLPAVLVVPIPLRRYDVLTGGYTATWTCVAIVPGPGDEKAAKALEKLVDTIARILPVESAEPATYKLPSGADPLPAYLCKFTTEVTTDDDQGL